MRRGGRGGVRDEDGARFGARLSARGGRRGERVTEDRDAVLGRRGSRGHHGSPRVWGLTLGELKSQIPNLAR